MTDGQQSARTRTKPKRHDDYQDAVKSRLDGAIMRFGKPSAFGFGVRRLMIDMLVSQHGSSDRNDR
jgi:hypothetical protein